MSTFAQQIFARRAVTSADFLKRYEIKSEIGKGAQGQVYLMRNLQNNSMVATKVFNDLQSAAAEVIFLSSIRSASSCQRYLPCLIDFFWVDRLKYFVVERLIEGKTLEKIRLSIAPRANTLIPNPWLRNATRIFYECAIALRGIHSAGLIHNDIKPGNIMYDEKSNVPVTIDFDSTCAAVNTREVRAGIMRKKKVPEETQQFKSLLLQLVNDNRNVADNLLLQYRCNRDMVFKITPEFAAPDLLLFYTYLTLAKDGDENNMHLSAVQKYGMTDLIYEDNVNEFFTFLRKHDVYCLGASMYFFIAGASANPRVPGGSALLTVRNVIKNGAEFLSRDSAMGADIPNVSPALNKILRKCLAPLAKNRPTSSALLKELEKLK